MTTDQLLLVALRLAMVVLLYLFLFWVMRSLWADLRSNAMPATAGTSGGRAPAARLVLLDTTTGGIAAGNVLPVQPLTTIGRADDNTIIIEDEFVSSHHATLRQQNGRWWLSDVGSTNGTWANERRADSPVAVKPGDTLRFGHLRTRFEI